MLKRRLATTVCLAALLGAAPTPASADTVTGCTGTSSFGTGCSSGTVTVTVTTPSGQAATLALQSNGTVVCAVTGVTVPCEVETDYGMGWWSASRGAWVVKVTPKPAPEDPRWEGNTTGDVYAYYPYVGAGAPSGLPWGGPPGFFWAATPPASPLEVLQLVGQATQTLNLQAIRLGMAPTPTSLNNDSIGIVGMPVWLWVASPSANTWGPISGSASGATASVTVTAQAEKVTWNLGDGSAPIVCGAGSPYDPSYGKVESPTCGTPGYTKQGTYPISAVTHWRIDYTSNVGMSGALTMELATDAQLTVGELQVTSR